MNKSIVVGAIVAFLLIVTSGVYFLTREEKAEDLFSQKNKLEGNLATAKGKLQQEQNNLDSLKAGLRDSFPLAVGVQEQMRRASGLVTETDYLFTNPLSSNPQLVFTNPLLSLKINEKRAEINLLLAEWQKKDNAMYLSKINISEAEKIQAEAEIIKSFLEDLANIVANLTVENSGLTQFQIDTYVYGLPSVEVINEVIVSLGEIINTYENNPEGVAQVEDDYEPASNINWNSTPSQVVVTPEQVVVAEQSVAVVQAEVQSIEAQLAVVNEQIEAQSPTVYVPPEDTTSDSGVPVVNDGSDANGVNNPTSPTTPSGNTPAPSQGIVVQPGAPRLIQGSNPF